MPQPNNDFSTKINNIVFKKKLEKLGFKKESINSYGNNYGSSIYGSIISNGNSNNGNTSVETKSLFDF
jgi:delta-aminolevulinic acid dehydratase/porphobilinogen synthase